ncbi:hypothetical protein F7Q93_11250 [Brucella pituitosa]|uniref:Uncharacterized protein n=1 Tax=Brucella pituitosa TaxID=571256 RepID=A0A643EZC3_9HYPH|nr:hypothetical protein F7Q93_11250 [Brucella pituitosa]
MDKHRKAAVQDWRPNPPGMTVGQMPHPDPCGRGHTGLNRLTKMQEGFSFTTVRPVSPPASYIGGKKQLEHVLRSMNRL